MSDCTSPCGCETLVLPVGPRGLPGAVGPTPNISFSATAGAPGTGVVLSQGGTPLAPTVALTIATGNTGGAGAAGQNAFTYTTAAFVQPVPDITAPYDTTITIPVIQGQFPGILQWVYITGGGYYRVISQTATSLTLVNSGLPENSAPGVVIPSGASVSPAGPQGPAGATGAGTPGTNGLTPFLRSGSGVPSNSLGVDGDWYIQQVNTGRVVFYGKAAGVYTAQTNVTGNRFFSFTVDPNTVLGSYNTNDYGVYVFGGMAYFIQYVGTWNTLFSWSLTAGTGPAWGFYATKANIQPLPPTVSIYSKVNFEESEDGINFNNGSWSLNTYTFANGETQKKFVLNALSFSRTVTTGGPTFTISIVKNGNTGSPVATTTLTFTGTNPTTSLPVLQTSLADYIAGDTVSVQVAMGGTSPSDIVVSPGSSFYIST